MFLGFLQKIRTSNDWMEMIQPAKTLQAVTSIPWYKIMKQLQVSGETARVSNLIALFNTAQYGHIFSSATASIPSILAVMPNILSRPYASGENVRVRFDYAETAGWDYHHGAVYVVHNGMEFPNALPIDAVNGQLFLDIPVEQLSRSLPFSAASQQATIQLKFAGWFTKDDGMQSSMTTTGGMSQSITIPCLTDKRLSDDPVENAVLNQLAFPVAAGDWSYGMGSIYHKERGLYALDLNALNDEGTPVTVAATGTVIDVELSTGSVYMKHTTPDGNVWYSNYHHLTHILEALTGVAYVATTEAVRNSIDPLTTETDRARAQTAIDALIAQNLTLPQHATLELIGTEGDSDGPHLHLDSYLADNTPVNLFGWADAMQPGFTISGTAGGKTLNMQWEKTEMSLMNTTEGILIERNNITDASGTIIDAENITYAWDHSTATKIQISWQPMQYANESEAKYRWLRTDNTLLEWSGGSWIVHKGQ